MRAVVCALALAAGMTSAVHAAEDGPVTTSATASPPAQESITPPSVIDDAQPIYPQDAFRDDVQGPVIMDLDIDADGFILAVRIKQSPDARLTWAALGAATNMSFVPAQSISAKGAQPIAVRVEFTLNFTIDEVERERVLHADDVKLLAEQHHAPVNLIGRVFVAGVRERVPGAVVSIDGTELETLSDGDGAFSLAGVPDGKHTIHVEASGFEPYDAIETFHVDTRTDANLYLVRKAGAQNETVVTERKAQREVTERVLTQKELTRIPGTFGDPIRAVQRLPGVARTPFGLGAVIVRGGAPEDTVINIDGHQTRILFHLGAGPSVLNNDLIEKLEFFPGGQGVRYGRAIAGAIDVVTRDPKLDDFSGKVTVDVLQTGFRLEGPIAGGGFFLAGRRSYAAELLNIGSLISTFSGLNGTSFSLAPRYSDYQGKLFWKLPNNNSLTLNLFGSDDVLDFALDSHALGPQVPSSAGISTGFHRFNPVWKWRSGESNDDGTPKLRASISPMAELTYNENRFDLSQFKLDTQRVAVRAETEFRPVSGIGLLLGTDSNVGLFTSVTDVPSVVPDERLFPRPATSDPPRLQLTDKVTGASYAFYVEGNVNAGPVQVVAGLRTDLWTYYDQERASLDPRINARVQVLHGIVLKGNVGVYHEVDTPFELAKVFGNPNLPLKQGVQSGIGAELDLTRTLDFTLDVFLRNTSNIPRFVASPTAFVGSGAARVQAVGEGRAYGAEVLLRQRLDHGLFGWVAYTLMRSEERADAAKGIEGSEAEPWTVTAYDQTHILSIAASSELPWGLELGGAFRYVTGDPVTFAQGGLFDGDTARYAREQGIFRGTRLPAFMQLDVRVDKKFTFDTWSLALSLDVQNATNAQNFELFTYNYNFTAVQGFPGLPIIPVLGAEASF